MAFNTKVDVADTELEANEAVAAEAEDVTLEDEALVEAESDADEDNEEMDEEADESEDSLTYSNGVIEKIVAMATREVPHVLGMKGNLMHFVQEQFGAENLTKGVTVEVTDDTAWSSTSRSSSSTAPMRLRSLTTLRRASPSVWPR